MRKKSRRLMIRDVVTVGMLAAMCAIATSIKIPFGVAGAMIHLGSACVFIIGILFGGVYAGLAAAIGSAFFDLLFGFSPYTVWSFVIKGAAGFIVGVVALGRWPEAIAGDQWLLKSFLGMALASICTLAGYIFAWWAVSGSLGVAFANAPGSMITSGIGIVAALLAAPKLRKLLRRV